MKKALLYIFIIIFLLISIQSIFLVICTIIYYFCFLPLSLFHFNQKTVLFITSVLAMITFYILSTDKLQSKILKYDEEDQKDIEKDHIKLLTFFLSIIPIKTSIFTFYFLILILNQISTIDISFDLISLLPNDFQEFLKINEYTIIYIIAFDRIVNSLKKEKISVSNIKYYGEVFLGLFTREVFIGMVDIFYKRFKKNNSTVTVLINNKRIKFSSYWDIYKFDNTLIGQMVFYEGNYYGLIEGEVKLGFPNRKSVYKGIVHETKKLMKIRNKKNGSN